MDFQLLIISGVARSGKSTLAHKLSKKLNYSYLGTDDIRFMVEKRFTSEETKLPQETRNTVVWPYVESLVRTRHKFGNAKDGFIIEGDILNPERIATLQDLENAKMACLAYPNILVEEKFRQIRQYKHEWDWTNYYQ